MLYTLYDVTLNTPITVFNCHIDRVSIYTMNIILFPSFISMSKLSLWPAIMLSPLLSWLRHTYHPNTLLSPILTEHHFEVHFITQARSSRPISRMWLKQNGLLEPELQQIPSRIKHKIILVCTLIKGPEYGLELEARASRYRRQGRK